MSDMEEIMRCISLFSALPDLIRYSPNRRILTEMTIIRACRSAMDEGAEGGGILPLENIKNRIREMEQQLYHNETAIDALMKGGAVGGFGDGGFSDSAGAASGFSGGGSGGCSGRRRRSFYSMGNPHFPNLVQDRGIAPPFVVSADKLLFTGLHRTSKAPLCKGGCQKSLISDWGIVR